MNDSLLLRRPALSRHLGPVVAATRRLASRYANSLRGGSPAAPEDLHGCGLILVHPGDHLERALSLLRTAGPWQGCCFALLHPHLDASALDELRKQGARACSVAAIPSRARDTVLIEGDRAAVLRARPWLREAHLRCLDLAAGLKALFLLGTEAAPGLLIPLLDASLQALRAAGIRAGDARRLLHETADSALRAFLARGSKSWENPVAPARIPLLESRLAAAAAADPDLAAFLAGLFETVRRRHGAPQPAAAAAEPRLHPRAAGIGQL